MFSCVYAIQSYNQVHIIHIEKNRKQNLIHLTNVYCKFKYIFIIMCTPYFYFKMKIRLITINLFDIKFI